MRICLSDASYIEIDEDGILSSYELKDSCPYCGKPDCYADCDGSQGDVDGLESEEDMIERRVTNARIDGMESLILALHHAGYDVTDKKFTSAVETACDAISNQA